MYTIKEAAARTGVPIELLRAWERRYGIVSPERTAGGYRLYDDASIERLRAMRRLVDGGWTPSVAAGAVLRAEPSAAVVEPAAGAVAATPEAGPRTDRDPGTLITAFVDRAAAMDAPGLERVLDEIVAAGSFEAVADGLLLPALAAMGDGWASGRVSVAAEHAASHAVLRRLAAAFQAAGRPTPAAGAVLVGLPPGCRHELAALAFAVAARRAGLAVLYVGPDLPATDWAAAVEAAPAAAVVIGAPTDDDVRAAVAVASVVRETSPDVIVAFGGRAAAAAARGAGGSIVLPQELSAAVDALAGALAG